MSPALESGGYAWASLPRVPDFPEAACRDRSDLCWIPLSEKGSKAQLAARVCLTCPHLVECGMYAISITPPLSGIWGGLTTAQRLEVRAYGKQHRSALIKERKDQIDRECPHCGFVVPTAHGLKIHLSKIHSRIG